MTRLLGGALTLLVSLSVLTIASPAQAGAGDSRTCVTTPEFKAIKKGQPKAAVTRLLDGRGGVATDRARGYAKCGSTARIVITFTKKYSSPGARVRSKSILHPRATQPTQPAPDQGSYPPASSYDCPQNAPIKGNEPSMIYHPPASPWYDITTPEQCFATESAAQAAGYRRANY